MAPKKSKSTKEDEATEKHLQFPKNIRELTSSLKLDLTLIPSTTTIAKATLGPTFTAYFPDELAPYYPFAIARPYLSTNQNSIGQIGTTVKISFDHEDNQPCKVGSNELKLMTQMYGSI